MGLCKFLNENGGKCGKSASFNVEGKKAEYCRDHKKENMVDVKHKKCIHIDDETRIQCDKNPSFNYEGKKAEYCNDHKKENMVDVKHKKCIHIDDETRIQCDKNPSFNYEGKKAEYCNDHKKENMVDVVHRKCIHIDENRNKCDKIPYYNKEGENPKFCAKHKEENMIDVRSKKCIHIDENGNRCDKIPCFNYEGKINPIYCNKHKEENMINICYKKCIYIDKNGIKCINNAYYNIKNDIALYCNKHKIKDMINVSIKKCIHIYENGNKCDKIPSFNYEGETKLYCDEHKKEGMVNVKNKKCIHCLTQRINEFNSIYKAEKSCAYCFYNLYPDHILSKNYKTKELIVVDFIKDNFPDFEFTFDQKIPGGCSRRRPDIYLDLKTHSIIVEIDENQHIDYDTTCETQRVNDLYSDIGLPIVFIRFNPDEYKIGDKNITSCFGILKNGKLELKQSKKSEWSERLETLKNTIIDNIKFPEFQNELAKFIYLFYDQ